MPVTIKPQDKTPLETLQLELHPALVSRLASYAKSLNDSDVSYVVSQILEQTLPADKPAKTRSVAPAKKAGKAVA